LDALTDCHTWRGPGQDGKAVNSIFWIMTSQITNNVSALFALGNGPLPLRKIARAEADRRRDRETTTTEPVRRDLVPMPAFTARRRTDDGDSESEQRRVFTESV
jgi:hypothetical protein